jgi:cytochrome c oxidase assembly factor CtaG
LSALTEWSFEPWAIVPLLISAVLYLAGSRRRAAASTLGRPVRRWHTALFWSGWVILAMALISPLHELGEHLFSAHMVEHELLMVAAAPLLVAARPIPAMLLGLPEGWRRRLLSWARRPGPRRFWSAATELRTATVLHIVVLWIWHLPALFTAALGSEAIHILQHLSFFLSALCFWEACWTRHVRRTGQGEAALMLFLVSVQAGFLGALLTLSARLWYPADYDATAEFGLSPMEDQQLAGLIMWIPACSAYVVGGLIVAGRWLNTMERRHA